MRFTVSPLLFLLFFQTQQCFALYIGVNDLSANTTAEIAISSGEASLLELQIINDGPSNKILSLGQANLLLIPVGTTEGLPTLTASASSKPLFSGSLGIIANGNGSVTVQSGPALPPFQQPLDNGERGTLVDLSVTTTISTEGTFQLVASALDPGQISLSSNWLNAAVEIQPFLNSNRNGNNQIVLANITVTNLPEPCCCLMLSTCTILLTSCKKRNRQTLIQH